METIKWVLCPICGNKTRTIMQEDTELKNFPLYCPKCKQQTLVNVKHFVVSVSIDSANPGYFAWSIYNSSLFCDVKNSRK